jgi:transposase-like protein
MLMNIKHLVDEERCYEMIRQLRWPEGKAVCPHCAAKDVAKRGKADGSARQRYHCGGCGRQFDDLTGTIFAARHQSLKLWILCLYFMGLNLSNAQIAKELELNEGDVHMMTSELRNDIVERKPKVELSGEVELDEVYVVAGHKGNPDAVKKKGAADAATA